MRLFFKKSVVTFFACDVDPALGAVRWIVRDADFQPQTISQLLQRPLEDMPLEGLAAPAVSVR